MHVCADVRGDCAPQHSRACGPWHHHRQCLMVTAAAADRNCGPPCGSRCHRCAHRRRCRRHCHRCRGVAAAWTTRSARCGCAARGVPSAVADAVPAARHEPWTGGRLQRPPTPPHDHLCLPTDRASSGVGARCGYRCRRRCHGHRALSPTQAVTRPAAMWLARAHHWARDRLVWHGEWGRRCWVARTAAPRCR